MEILEKEKCCGCESCAISCPVNCIQMQEDEEGFLYPFIDDSRCIGCYSCKRHCPVLLLEVDKNGNL